MENQILIALKNNKLLKNILFSELDISGIKGNLLTLSEGEILYREDEKSEFLYMVVGGEINVLRKKGSNRALSEIYTDHDFFGSDEFIENSKRKSTAVALRDSYIIALTKEEIDSLIEQNDEILTNLYESLQQEETGENVDIITPDIDEINFKKTRRTESNFAKKIFEQSKKGEERVKSEEDAPEENESIGANDSAAFNPKTTDDVKPSPATREPESQAKKDLLDDQIEGASIDKVKSFNKIEQPPSPASEKSFLEKINLAAENKSKTGIEKKNDKTGQSEDAEPGNHDEDVPQDRFPTAFEVSVSYSDVEEESKSQSPEEELVEPDNTGETGENLEKEWMSGSSLYSPVPGDKLEEAGQESPEREVEDNDELNLYVNKLDIRKRDKISLSDFSFADEDNSANEETLPDSGQSAGDLEDFYASLSEQGSAVEQNEDSPERDDDNWLSAVDFNLGNESTNDESVAGNEEDNTDYTGFALSEGYNPDMNYTGEKEEPEDKLNESEEGVKPDGEEWSGVDSILPIEGELNPSEYESVGKSEEPGNKFAAAGLYQPADETGEEVEKEMTELKEKNNAKSQLRDYDEFEQTIDMLEKINKAAQVVNSNIKIDDVFKSIVDVALELTNADRGTLYLVDKNKNELWSKIALGNEFKEIKLAMGEGIAGWVGQKGEIINLDNVREDPRFNVSFDKSSGYLTQSMLCFPIRNKNEEIVGVLQLINSRNGKFSKLDEESLGALSMHASMAIQNADLVEQLLTGERVASLGKMANFLIQDIKKPIMVSKRYAEHLKSKVLEEDIGRVVDMLLDQLNHIADLVQSTSSYSEGQIVLRSIMCKMNETLDDYLTRVDSIVRGLNCQIVKEYDKEVSVKISPKQLFQCFQHIVKNACEAMPEGGTVHLSTRKEKDRINIIIRDTGLGIAESLQQKIFEPFMSHGKKEGTGLGLSITKKIIEEHGGTISVKSELGEGAAFTISLPVVY